MPSEFWPSRRPGYLLIRALQWHIFYLTKVIKAKTMNEHVTRILSLNYKTHLVEFVTPTCLVGSLEVKIILIRQTNVLFLVSAFLRGSLNAMVSSPSHFWSEVRRGRTEPLCNRISGISGIRDSLSSFADSKAKNSGLHKQNCPGFHFSDAKNYRIPESKFPYLGRNTAKVELKEASPLFSGEPFPSWLFQI